MNAYLTLGSCNADYDSSVWTSDTKTGLILRSTGKDFQCLAIANEFQKQGGPVGIAECDANNPSQQWILPEEVNDYGPIKSALNNSLCLSTSMPVFGGENAMGSLTLDLCDINVSEFEIMTAASSDELADLEKLSKDQIEGELEARGIEFDISDSEKALRDKLAKELLKESKDKGVEDEDEDDEDNVLQPTFPEYMSLDELKNQLKKRGLSTKGTKPKLADRLSDALEDESGKLNRLQVVGKRTANGHVPFIETGQCIALRVDDDLDDLKASCPHGMVISDLTLEPCGASLPVDTLALPDNNTTDSNSTDAPTNGSTAAPSVRPPSVRQGDTTTSNNPSFLDLVSDSAGPSSVYGKGCWKKCGQGGKCPTDHCGSGGFCCRKGVSDPG